MGGGPFGLRRRRLAVGERDRRRRAVLVFGRRGGASRAAPTLVRGLGIVSFRQLGVSHGVRRDGVYDRRGSLSRPTKERQPRRTPAERQRCEISAVPLAQQRVLVVVLNLGAGIARFQDGVAETSPGSASESPHARVRARFEL